MDPQIASPAPQGEALGVTASMYESLKATRPWVTFLGVMGFISVGLMVLMALFMMVAGGAMGRGAAFGFGMGLVYLVLAVFYVFPALFLVRYGGALKKLFTGGGAPALEEALATQKSFWKFVGVLTIVGIALMVVLFAIGMVAGLAGVGAMR